MFTKNIYIRIFENRILAKNVDTAEFADIPAIRPFSHPRSLLGDFAAANETLKTALRAVKGRSFFMMSGVVMHAMEKNEGGLTLIEQRALIELAIGCGASKAVVWQGPSLRDDQVREKIREAKFGGSAAQV